MKTIKPFYKNQRMSEALTRNSVLFFSSFILFLLLCPLDAFSQDSFSWKVLEDVKWEEKMDENEGYWLVPVFGKKPKSYQNKRVTLEGHFIPLDVDGKVHVLSKYPYANCFFCGGAGPESIVEVQLEESLSRQIRMDQKVRFQGRLVLNDSDYDHFNYILKEAKLVK